jgi:FtsP/CotA-like multicopper oxidase with cupredoxin domain
VHKGEFEVAAENKASQLFHYSVFPNKEYPNSADITLRIAPVTVELAPDRILSTIGYNGTSPGPVLRMKEGKPVTVDVINETDTPELVHWHGFLIPSDVDGSEEEGTPPSRRTAAARYSSRPAPSGSRWYHSHAMSMADLHKGTYTGQFGFVYIEPASNPGAYDQELFLALRDWEPFFTTQMVDMDETTTPTPRSPSAPPCSTPRPTDSRSTPPPTPSTTKRSAPANPSGSPPASASSSTS